MVTKCSGSHLGKLLDDVQTRFLLSYQICDRGEIQDPLTRLNTRYFLMAIKCHWLKLHSILVRSICFCRIWGLFIDQLGSVVKSRTNFFKAKIQKFAKYEPDTFPLVSLSPWPRFVSSEQSRLASNNSSYKILFFQEKKELDSNINMA